MKCKTCATRSNACESCKEIRELIMLITSMLRENEKIQEKIVNLMKEPVGLHLEHGLRLIEILGNMNSMGQSLEEERRKIVQQLKCTKNEAENPATWQRRKS